ncbi:MAG: ABC transporter substrate-binding protein [Deltaproteobacteria bacterium]|nr:ABC transporter substrate-binding protein [Deltaproteobacteria bacterium]
MKNLFIFLTISILISFFDVHASEPFTILKGEIDQVFSILNDPVYSDATKKDEQNENLWKIIENAFDFNVMSRLTLANNWKSFSSDQKNEFARVFGRFLSNMYLEKIQSGYSGEQVEYLGEEILTDTKAVVMTHIIRNDVKTPVDYSMQHNKNSWKIYDVKIEGVSLLKNYRTQFASILLNKKPDELIEMLKDKIKQ